MGVLEVGRLVPAVEVAHLEDGLVDVVFLGAGVVGEGQACLAVPLPLDRHRHNIRSTYISQSENIRM